jgi:hypothetical protein
MLRARLPSRSLFSGFDRAFLDPIRGARGTKTVHAIALVLLPYYSESGRRLGWRLATRALSIGDFDAKGRKLLTKSRVLAALERREDLVGQGFMFLDVYGLAVVRRSKKQRGAAQRGAPKFWSLKGIRLPARVKGKRYVAEDFGDVVGKGLRARAASIRRGDARARPVAKNRRRHRARRARHGMRQSNRKVLVRTSRRKRKSSR